VPDEEQLKNIVRRTPFPPSGTSPLVPPIVPSAVFVACDADHMNDVYEGRQQGFTYAREASPNAELLAAKIAALEGWKPG
jgi:cystathionine gamma-synthase